MTIDFEKRLNKNLPSKILDFPDDAKPMQHQIRVMDKTAHVNNFALFWEMGCIFGEEKVYLNCKGYIRELSLKELYKWFNNTKNRIHAKVRAFKGTGIGLHSIKDVVYSGIKPCYKLTLADGKTVIGTYNHEILTKSNKWIQLGKCVGKLVAVQCDKKLKAKNKYNSRRVGKYHPYGQLKNVIRKDRGNKEVNYLTVELHRLIYEANINNLSLEDFIKATKEGGKNLKFVNPKIWDIHHIDGNHKNNEVSNLQKLTKKAHQKIHIKDYTNKDITYSEAIKVEYVGLKETYDIVCADPHRNFVTNGIVVHNSGKTFEEIARYRYKCFLNNRLLRCLIICPLVVMENWKREIVMFSKIPESAIQVVNGISDKSRAKKKSSSMKIKLQQLDNPDTQIFITNTETLQGLQSVSTMVGGKKRQTVKEKEILLKLKEMGFEYIIVDESHRFKSPTGVRSKTIHIIGDRPTVKYKTILTGTPITNDPSDIWSQFRFLDKFIFGDNFFNFRRRYFIDENSGMPSDRYFPSWKLNPEFEHELRLKIAEHSDRVLKEQVLDLPPKHDYVVNVALSKEQQKLYTQMSKEMVATINVKQKIKLAPDGLDETLLEQLEEMGLNTSKVMSVDLAIVKGLRLQQLVSGIFTDDETGETHLIDNEADRKLEELLHKHINIEADQKNKVIIWCVFKQSYEVIAKICEKVLPKDKTYTFLTGQQDYDEKVANMDKFNFDPNCVVIIGNQAAGGTGCNLKGANKAYYYSRDYNYEKDAQSDSRNHRGGQTRTCERYDFVRKGTVDEQAFLAIKRKKKSSKDILDVKVTSIFKEIEWSKLT